jgi:uncharacterized membrane protein
MAERVIRSRLVGINVPTAERIASVAIGSAFAFVGVRRRDIAGFVLAAIGGALVARGVTGRCGLYRMRAARKGIEVRRAVTVQASPGEVYELWREMRGSVDVLEDAPARRLRWRSLPGDELRFEGTLDLIEAIGDRGTIVDVRILYRPRGGLVVSGMLGNYLRKLHGIELAEELARMRMVLETGELATGAMTARDAIAEELRP